MVPNVRIFTLVPKVLENVDPEAVVNTDALMSYRHLDQAFEAHQWFDHAEAYVNGTAHTNNAESFWALLKRGLKGTYIATRPHHLNRYVEEGAFRFNGRKGKDTDRFCAALKATSGKRLTYRDLIAANPHRIPQAKASPDSPTQEPR